MQYPVFQFCEPVLNDDPEDPVEFGATTIQINQVRFTYLKDDRGLHCLNKNTAGGFKIKTVYFCYPVILGYKLQIVFRSFIIHLILSAISFRYKCIMFADITFLQNKLFSLNLPFDHSLR